MIAICILLGRPSSGACSAAPAPSFLPCRITGLGTQHALPPSAGRIQALVAPLRTRLLALQGFKSRHPFADFFGQAAQQALVAPLRARSLALQG